MITSSVRTRSDLENDEADRKELNRALGELRAACERRGTAFEFFVDKVGIRHDGRICVLTTIQGANRLSATIDWVDLDTWAPR